METIQEAHEIIKLVFEWRRVGFVLTFKVVECGKYLLLFYFENSQLFRDFLLLRFRAILSLGWASVDHHLHPVSDLLELLGEHPIVVTF